MGPGQQGVVQVNWHDASGKLLQEQVEVINTVPRWERYRRSVTAPPGADRAVVYASALDPSTIWFDDLFFGAESGQR
jgi:hypothetical protein